MCGICGIHGPARGIDRSATVLAMNRALTHRGPDDSGLLTTATGALAMRRLAIIDLQTGQQPVANEQGNLAIILNGEIYNYRELRESLIASGRHQFKSRSDTEVILHLFEEQAESTPDLLNGMFAFCVYDQQEEELFLARDRFGEKPLFYSVVGDTFVFSSELASLVECPLVDRRLDTEALYYYLHFGFVPTPLTLYANVRQLRPGHWMRWSKGQLTETPYYVADYEVNPDLRDPETAMQEIRGAFLRAVKRQMMSDVPLGAFLSGGIDSSSVVAAMQRQSSAPIKTFTVRFEHAPYDESPIAREVARALGTDHHELTVTNEAFEEDDLWRVVRHVGQPFADSSAIPTYLISKYVRDHVTVCLSGDGGDEMFAGYKYFEWSLKIDQLARWVPAGLLRTGHSVARELTRLKGLGAGGVRRKMLRVTEVARLSAVERTSRLSGLFGPQEMRRLPGGVLAQAWREQSHDRLEQIARESESASRLRQLMHYRLRYSLAEDMLVKIDRMSMAASLEVRAPMLDADLARVAMQLPDDLLIKNGTKKYLLRQIARDWLPDRVFSHPKSGFKIPLHMFRNKAYAALCEDLVLQDRTGIMHQLFSPSMLRQVVRRGLEQKQDRADLSVSRTNRQLWGVLQLAAWLHVFDVRL